MSEILDSGERKTWNGKYNRRGDKRGCIGTHGMANSRLYDCWTDMKRRCYNQRNKRYDRYGGRGIQVCDEWVASFRSFYDWAMSHGYQDNLTLDRINVDGNYEPSNCRWVTRAEQNKNTSRNHYITINGVTKTMSDWAREYGVSPDLIKDRINKLHWAEEEAVTTPKLAIGGKRWQIS